MDKYYCILIKVGASEGASAKKQAKEGTAESGT
jgi:hypothetical protein